MTETCLPIVTWLKNWFTSTDDLIDKTYPIGSIYMSVNSTSPSTLFGGTWEQIKDRFLLACGDTYSNGATGGSANAVVVSHTHTQTQHRHQVGGKEWSTGTGKESARINTSNRTAGYKYTDYQAPTINSSGESGVGKNMPPYLAVYVWKRTA